MSISVSISGLPGYVEGGAQLNIDGLDPVDAAFQISQAHPGGVANLAQRMGINAGTLQNKLNPNNATHHLTLKEALTLQVVANNASILHAMAAQLGFVCTRATPDQAEGDPVEAFMLVQTAHAELCRAGADMFVHGGDISANEIRRLSYCAQESTAANSHLVATARARMPQRREV